MKKVVITIGIVLAFSVKNYSQNIDTMSTEEYIKYLEDKPKNYLKSIDTLNKEQFLIYTQNKLKYYLKNYRYRRFMRNSSSPITGIDIDKMKSLGITIDELYDEEMRLRVIELMSMKWTEEELDSVKKSEIEPYKIRNKTDDIMEIDKIRSYKEIYDSVYKAEYKNIKDEDIIEGASMDIPRVALVLKDKRFIKALKETYKRVSYGEIFEVLAGLKIEPYYGNFKKKYLKIKLNTVLDFSEYWISPEWNIVMRCFLWGKESIYLYSKLLLVKDFISTILTDLYDIKFRTEVMSELSRNLKNKEFIELVAKIKDRDNITDKEAQEIVKWIEKNKDKLEMFEESIKKNEQFFSEDVFYF